MGNQTNSNGRDESDRWVEGLLTGAGASIGRVLDDRQRHAARLALEVFVYLLVGMQRDTVEMGDVVRYLKWYARGFNDAKSSEG
jgi:hypothetical protein